MALINTVVQIKLVSGVPTKFKQEIPYNRGPQPQGTPVRNPLLGNGLHSRK